MTSSWKLLGLSSLCISLLGPVGTSAVDDSKWKLMLSGTSGNWRDAVPLKNGFPDGGEVMMTGMCPKCTLKSSSILTVRIGTAANPVYPMETCISREKKIFRTDTQKDDKWEDVNVVDLSSQVQDKLFKPFINYVKRNGDTYEARGYLLDTTANKWISAYIPSSKQSTDEKVTDISSLLMDAGRTALTEKTLRIYFRNMGQ